MQRLRWWRVGGSAKLLVLDAASVFDRVRVSVGTVSSRMGVFSCVNVSASRFSLLF